MPQLRGLVLLAVIAIGGVGLLSVYAWLTEEPPRPSPSATPPIRETFEATVDNVALVTRGGKFTHYEIRFSRATNGLDTLNYHTEGSDAQMKAFIGQRVKVNCNRLPSFKSCHWLTRMDSGSSVITQTDR